MVESLQSVKPGFTTIKYTTKDGENISATKNNGIVTLVGDKNGIRQMPLEDFKKELIENLADVKLENTPAKDTVELSNATPKNEPKQAAPTAAQNGTATAKPEENKKLDVAV